MRFLKSFSHRFTVLSPQVSRESAAIRPPRYAMTVTLAAQRPCNEPVTEQPHGYLLRDILLLRERPDDEWGEKIRARGPAERAVVADNLECCSSYEHDDGEHEMPPLMSAELSRKAVDPSPGGVRHGDPDEPQGCNGCTDLKRHVAERYPDEGNREESERGIKGDVPGTVQPLAYRLLPKRRKGHILGNDDANHDERRECDGVVAHRMRPARMPRTTPATAPKMSGFALSRSQLTCFCSKLLAAVRSWTTSAVAADFTVSMGFTVSPLWTGIRGARRRDGLRQVQKHRAWGRDLVPLVPAPLREFPHALAEQARGWGGNFHFLTERGAYRTGRDRYRVRRRCTRRQ